MVALILLGSAFMDYRDDMDNAPERTRQGFADIHDDAALSRDIDEARSRTNSEEIRAVAGAAFLAAGLFIFGTHRRKEDKT